MNLTPVESVYLFIAELLGYKQGTVPGKLSAGIEAYLNKQLPEYNEDNLHEFIWLERLYGDLERYDLYVAMGGDPNEFHWKVPIELDASASLLGYIGCLLGDVRMLEATNMAGPEDQLKDPWHLDGLTRKQVKTACTPKLYGSGKAVQELWVGNKVGYTLDQLALMNQELKKGMFGTADLFKEFIINNCEMKPVMDVHVWNDKFSIECNRYKRIGEATIKYDIYDSETGRIRRIAHTKTKAVPDLDAFKRFGPTCLVHCLDSQVADTVAGKCYVKYGFCIDIHDAFVVSPHAAADVRKWYSEEMGKIYKDRKAILSNFFSSLGIGARAMAEWEAVMSTVVPVNDDWTCRGTVLK